MSKALEKTVKYNEGRGGLRGQGGIATSNDEAKDDVSHETCDTRPFLPLFFFFFFDKPGTQKYSGYWEEGENKLP